MKIEQADSTFGFEQGMHSTCLVRDPEVFARNPGIASAEDRCLSFGLTYQEWHSLFFDVLGLTDGSPEEVTVSPTPGGPIIELETEIPGYPMLSRIKGYLYDTVFRRDEIAQLRDECLQLETKSSNQPAMRGLRKLLKMCDLAEEAGLSIYLMAE